MHNKLDRPPPPTIETDVGTLPSALSFFVTLDQRRMLLKALRGLKPDRTGSLIMALGLVESDQKNTMGERTDG